MAIKKPTCNDLHRDVTSIFKSVRVEGIVSLARLLVAESQESAEVLRQCYRERRQCKETTKAGRPCKAWALWECPDQLCAAHYYQTRGPELDPDERKAREKYRTRPTCNCAAYPFPHRPGNALCRWPLEPGEVHPMPAGKRAPGKLRRRRVRAIKRRYGVF